MSMKCSTCGSTIPANAQFCIECGAAVQSPQTAETIPLRQGTIIDAGCRSCGVLNPPQALFCMRCGTRLSPPNAANRSIAVWVGLGLIALIGLMLFLRTPALLRFTPYLLGPLLLIAVAVAVARLFSRGALVPAALLLLWALGLGALLILPLPLRLPILLVLLGASVLIYVVVRGRRP